MRDGWPELGCYSTCFLFPGCGKRWLLPGGSCTSLNKLIKTNKRPPLICGRCLCEQQWEEGSSSCGHHHVSLLGGGVCPGNPALCLRFYWRDTFAPTPAHLSPVLGAQPVDVSLETRLTEVLPPSLSVVAGGISSSPRIPHGPGKLGFPPKQCVADAVPERG